MEKQNEKKQKVSENNRNDADKKIRLKHTKKNTGKEEWYEYDADGNETYFKDAAGNEEWSEYDKSGNLLHYRNSSGYEKWSEYNADGKEVHYIDSSGYETWTDYDKTKNMKHFKNNTGFEARYEYDENGNLVYYKDSVDDETWWEYDANGKETHFKNSDGFEKWSEYDKNGNETHFKNSNGYEIWREFDESGNQTYYRDDTGGEEWRVFDAAGNETHFKNNTGFEIWREYNGNGKMVHYKDSDKFEQWREYDESGNMVHHRDSDGNETWYEYDAAGNETHYRDSRGYETWTDYVMEEEIQREVSENRYSLKYDWGGFAEKDFQNMLKHIGDKTILDSEEVLGHITINNIYAEIRLAHGDGKEFSDEDPEEYGNEKTLKIVMPGYIAHEETVTPKNTDLESYEAFRLHVKEDIIEPAGKELQKDRLEELLDTSEFFSESFDKIKAEAMNGEATEREGEFSGRIKAGLIDIDIMLYHDTDGEAFIDLEGYYPITDLSMSADKADEEAYAWDGKYTNALPYKNFYVGTILDIKEKAEGFGSFRDMLKSETANMLLDEETRLGNDAAGLKNSEIMELAESDETWDSLKSKWIEKQLEQDVDYLDRNSGMRPENPEYSKYVDTFTRADLLMKEQADMFLFEKSDMLYGDDPEKFAEALQKYMQQDDLWNVENVALDALAAGRPSLYHAVCHNCPVDPMFVEDHLAALMSPAEPDTERIRNIIASLKNEGIDDEVTGMDFEIPFRAALSGNSGIINAVFGNMTDEEKLEFLGERGGYEKIRMQAEKNKGAEKSLAQIAESCGYAPEAEENFSRPESKARALVEEIKGRAVCAKPGFDSEKETGKEKNIPSRADDGGMER